MNPPGRPARAGCGAQPGLELDGGGGSAELYRQLGQITRQLHDALLRLGVMPRLQQSAQDLPDVRSRLQYVARKTGEAAERALSAVERAKHERARLDAAAQRLAPALPAGAAAELAELRAAGRRIDAELTEILLAQDFHDLTDQVLRQVVALAVEVEDNLVELLLRAAPGEPIPPPARRLGGPVVDAGGGEVVRDQQEVDALLAGLGF